MGATCAQDACAASPCAKVANTVCVRHATKAPYYLCSFRTSVAFVTALRSVKSGDKLSLICTKAKRCVISGKRLQVPTGVAGKRLQVPTGVEVNLQFVDVKDYTASRRCALDGCSLHFLLHLQPDVQRQQGQLCRQRARLLLLQPEALRRLHLQEEEQRCDVLPVSPG